MIVLFSCLAVQRVEGQQAREASIVGRRVRVTQCETHVATVGVLMGVSKDSLLVQRGRRRVSTPLACVGRLEVSEGGGGASGPIVGFVLGYAVAYGVTKAILDSRYPSREAASENAFISALAALPTGGLLGASVGAGVTRERWVTVGVQSIGGGMWGLAVGYRVSLR